eukprot:UN29590
MEKYPSVYLTAYVVRVMQIAKGYNLEINDEAYTQAIKYLTNYVKNPRKERYKYLLETFSLIEYIFALDKIDVQPLQELLLEKKKELSLRGQGYLLLGLLRERSSQDSEIQELIRHLNNRLEITTRKVSVKEEP